MQHNGKTTLNKNVNYSQLRGVSVDSALRSSAPKPRGHRHAAACPAHPDSAAPVLMELYLGRVVPQILPSLREENWQIP